MAILQIHLPIPQTGDLVVDFSRLLVLDRPSNGVIRAGKIALGFKLYIRDQIVLRTPDVAVVSELIFHLPEEDSTRVHVGLGQDAGRCQHHAGQGRQPLLTISRPSYPYHGSITAEWQRLP